MTIFRDSSGHRQRVLLALLVLLSGFCGVSYEVLYARLIGDLVGDQFTVNATVLLTFLLGIGFGTLYAHRLWRHLWRIEAGIGLFGLFLASTPEWLDRWLYIASPILPQGIAASALLCALLVSLPAFLIGCSLPLFAGYLATLGRGRVFGMAYSAYNLGAALTVLLIEFWLLREIGLRASLVGIAAINGLVSLLLVLEFRRIREHPPAPTEPTPIRLRSLAALALICVASGIFQLTMLRIAEYLLGPFRETFALVLSLVFFGIALGTTLTARLRMPFAAIALAIVLGLAWLLAATGGISSLYAQFHPAAAESYPLSVLLKLGCLAALMGVPAVFFGSTIPALLRREGDVARESGRLLFVASLANVVGFVLMAFVLHRSMDYGTLILLAAFLTVLSLLVQQRPTAPRLAAAVGLMVGLIGVHQGLWQEKRLFLGHTAFHSSEDLDSALRRQVSSQEFRGRQDVLVINQSQHRSTFFINGYNSMVLESPAEKIVGAFSSLFAPHTDRALVLGVGSGATAGTVAQIFEHTDAVEISAVILDNLERMRSHNFDLSANARVDLIHDDAMHFVRTARTSYSLIINTVTSPLYFSSSKLYTHDFFGRVRERLAPQGVYVTWVDSRVGDTGLDIILATLSRSFDNCWMGGIRSSYFLLLCSEDELHLRRPHLIESNPVLARYFRSQGLHPGWLAYGVLSTRALRLASTAATEINTLDHPVLEFEMARLRKRGIRAFKRRLRRSMSLHQIDRALAPVMDWRIDRLIAHARQLYGDSTITDRWLEVFSAWKHRPRSREGGTT